MVKHSLLPDLLITVPTLLLLSLGILVIYTSDAQLAYQQSVVAVVGLVLYFFLSLISFDIYERYLNKAYIVVLLALLMVFILGIESRGSVRWIPIGPFRLQPSELAKPVLILMLAKFWTNKLPSWRNLVKSILIVAPALALVFKQPDLGTTIVLFNIWLFMLIASNISAWKMLTLGVITSVLTPIAWLFLKDYQRVRLLSFLAPQQDPLGLGYNVIQSTIAVGSGEAWGRGLGRGTQSRLQFLPEFRTDFIFASIAEELGLVGSVILISLYSILLIRCFQIMAHSLNRMGNLIVIGVVSMIFVQVFVNIGMNIGVMPITGITLPLISYGGSSLLVTLISLGLVVSVARYSAARQEGKDLD